MSTATLNPTAAEVGQHARVERPTYDAIPMRTIMGVELRKMFNTRSGFWLMSSVVILAVIATGAVILFAPNDEISYDSFAGAIGIPGMFAASAVIGLVGTIVAGYAILGARARIGPAVVHAGTNPEAPV